ARSSNSSTDSNGRDLRPRGTRGGNSSSLTRERRLYRMAGAFKVCVWCSVSRATRGISHAVHPVSAVPLHACAIPRIPPHDHRRLQVRDCQKNAVLAKKPPAASASLGGATLPVL